MFKKKDKFISATIKIICVFTCIVFGIHLSYSQVWEFGEEVKSKRIKTNSALLFLPGENNSFVVHRTNGKEISYTLFDSSMNFVKSESRTITKRKESTEIKTFTQEDTSIIFRFHFTAINKFEITVEKYVAGKLILQKSVVELLSKEVDFNAIHLRKEGKGFLMYYEATNNARGPDEEIWIYWINKDMGLENSQSYTIPVLNSLNDVKRLDQLPDSSIEIVSKRFHFSRREKRAGKGNYYYCLTSFSPGNSLPESEIALSYPKDHALMLRTKHIEDQIFLAYPSSSISNSYSDSLNYVLLSPMRDSVFHTRVGIEEYNLVKNSYFYDQVRNSHRSIYVDFIDTNQLGYCIGSEMLEVRFFGGYGENAVYSYGFGSIILHQLDRGGNIIWTNVINKNQITDSDKGIYSSYLIQKKDQGYIIFYNVDVNNKRTKRMKYSSEIQMAQIRFDGSFKVESILQNEDRKKLGMLKSAVIRDGKMYVLFQGKKSYQIGCYTIPNKL